LFKVQSSTLVSANDALSEILNGWIAEWLIVELFLFKVQGSKHF